MRAALAFLAAAALLAPGLAGGDEGERLEKIRTEIEEREARARSFSKEAEGHLGELEAIDRDLAETRRSLTRLRRRQRGAEEDLGEAREALVAAERERAALEKDAKARVLALYKFRSTGGLPALASARDFESFARVGWGLARVLERDAVLFRRYRRATEALRASRKRAEALVTELGQAGREISVREERTRRKLVERRNLAALMHSRADRERRAAGELREAARRLEEALKRLPGGRKSPGNGLVRGRVSAPVRGPVRLGFGRQIDPEFGTETLRTGIELAGAPSAPVRAVAPGRVLFAGWFRGYGQMVIIDHGKGSMTVSGYLEEIAVEADDTVGGGQVIGTIGQTGTLSEPGLYFEIRKDGKAVDPELWLE